MKKMIVIAICLFSVFYTVVAQTELPRKTKFNFGFGIFFAGFYPEDVNDYISADLAQYQTDVGFKDLVMNFGGELSVGYRIYRFWEFMWLVEGATGIKYILISNGDSKVYNFSKLATGPMIKFHIPFGSIGKHSMFFGVGPQYNQLKFESFKATAIGAKAQIGVSFNNYKFNPQVYLGADYANADDGAFNLNYTSGKIGVHLNF